MPSIRTQAIQGVLWLGGQRIGVRILDQLFTIVLLRLLAPRDFGLLAAASVVSGVLITFSHSGISGAIVQRREIDDEYLSTAFWANVAIACSLFAVAVALSRTYGAFVREPLVGPLVIVLSLRTVIESTVITQAALISRRMEYRDLALRPFLGTVVGGAAGVAMALGGMGVWSLVGQGFGASTATTVAFFYGSKWRPKLRFSWRKFMDMCSFGGPVLVGWLLSYAVRNTDNLLIARYLGSVPLGYYALAYALFLAPLVDLGLPMRQVMFSALARLQKEEERLKRGFLLVVTYTTMVAMPFTVGLSLVAPLAVEIVFGAKWLPSAPVLSLLALAGFFHLMTYLGPSGFQAVGRPDLHMWWQFISVLLYFPAFVVGLRWGIVGVAAGFLVATAILTPIQWTFLTRAIGVTFTELWGTMFPSVVGCVVMAAVVAPVRWALASAGFPRIVDLAVLVLLGIAVYGAMTWMVQRNAVIRLVGMVREIRTVPPGVRLREVEEA